VSYLDDRAGLGGRVGVLVGGGGGLGRACALDLAGAGMRLALCDRDGAALAETASAIEATGGTVSAAELDVRDPEALAGFFGRVDDRLGPRLDVLVNVVGGTFRQPFVESVPRGWDALVRTNFTWLLHSTQLAVARMRPGGGSIINLTSIEAHRAAPGYAVYAAMKAAVTSLTRTLAVELAPDGIRVNTIAPDFIPTASLETVLDGSDEEAALGVRITTPMGRVGSFADAGGCALFLASDLSSFVTGSSLHPDGGALASSGWFNWPDDGFLNHPPPGVLGFLAGQEDVADTPGADDTGGSDVGGPGKAG
jgi:3-oxoacyl-[acyl-carrier protein] reductase